MDPDRTKRLQAILQWSLRQQEEEGERIQGPRGAQIDPEVMTNDYSQIIIVPPIISHDHGQPRNFFVGRSS